MRIAAIAAGTLVAIGLYTAVAAAFAFPLSMTGIGVLAISVTAAVAMVATERPVVRA